MALGTSEMGRAGLSLNLQMLLGWQFTVGGGSTPVRDPDSKSLPLRVALPRWGPGAPPPVFGKVRAPEGRCCGGLAAPLLSIHMSPPRRPTPHSSPEPPRFSERPPRCAIGAPPSQGFRNMFSPQMSQIALVLALTLTLALALTPTLTLALTSMELASIA